MYVLRDLVPQDFIVPMHKDVCFPHTGRYHNYIAQ